VLGIEYIKMSSDQDVKMHAKVFKQNKSFIATRKQKKVNNT
jgi:hypothetical protein